MKIKPKQYAIALYELSDGKTRADVDRLVENFIQTLARQARSKLLIQIFHHLEQYIKEKEHISYVSVTFASQTEEKDAVKRIGALEKLWKKKNIQISVGYDPTLLSGVRAEVDSVVIDASLRTQLRRLKECLLI